MGIPFFFQLGRIGSDSLMGQTHIYIPGLSWKSAILKDNPHIGNFITILLQGDSLVPHVIFPLFFPFITFIHTFPCDIHIWMRRGSVTRTNSLVCTPDSIARYHHAFTITKMEGNYKCMLGDLGWNRNRHSDHLSVSSVQSRLLHSGESAFASLMFLKVSLFFENFINFNYWTTLFAVSILDIV